MRTKHIFHASIAFVAFISSGAAFAATYNFYFNNTEQGNNSQATPNVTISQDGKSGGTEMKAMPIPNASSEPAVVPVTASSPVPMAPETAPGAMKEDPSPVNGPYPGPPGASTQVHFGESEYGKNDFRHFFLGPQVTAIASSDALGDSATAYGLDIGYSFTRDIAIRGYVGRYQRSYTSYSWSDSWNDGMESMTPSTGYNYTESKYFGGGELVVTPFHANERGPVSLDLGAVVGANSIRAQQDSNLYVPDIPINLYVGALVQLNVGQTLSIPVSYNIGSNVKYLQAGLSIRL